MAVTDAFPGKSPVDKLVYGFDFTPWAKAGDPLVAGEITIDPPNEVTVVGQVNINPPLVTVELTGGYDGTTYTITCVGTLASGQVVQHSAALAVAEN